LPVQGHEKQLAYDRQCVISHITLRACTRTTTPTLVMKNLTQLDHEHFY